MRLNEVYGQLAILFSTMLLGLILGKADVISKTAAENFSKFVVKVAIPALILSNMMLPLTGERLHTAINILLVAIPCYIASYLLGVLGSRFLCRNRREKAIFEYGMTFSNGMFMGLPVLQAILGNEAIFYAAVFNIVNNIFAFSLGIKIMSNNSEDTAALNLKSLLHLMLNPGILASVIGFILFLTQISLPGFLLGTIDSIAGICIPLSMLTIGAILNELPLRGLFNKPILYVLTIFRLIVLPLLTFLIINHFFGSDNLWLLAVSVVIAGMPIAANSAMFASEYGNDALLASQSVFLTTLFSCMTIPFLAFLFI